MKDIKVIYLPHPIDAIERQNSFLSEKICEKSAVCARARGFKVALLQVGVGQGWGAVEGV